MANHQIKIGEFIIEPLAGLVWHVDDQMQSIRLQPLVMRVLIVLANRAGDVVTREELIDEVWGRPVSDDVLTRSIHELRVVFRGNKVQQKYIETIPKIGYSLVVPVVDVRPVDEVGKSPSAPSVNRPNRQFYRSLQGRGAMFAVVCAITLTIALIIFLSSGERKGFDDQSPQRVVVASFENFTDDPRLARALDIAFRTGIEQSSHISIFSPAMVAASLERMRLARDTPVDRETAIEISLREQAQAVLVGAIARVGNAYRLSGEIIEPQTGRTVFSRQSDVVDEDRILEGLDEIVAAIRRGTGEAQVDIDASSEPLQRVTTANFEALEAYSIAMQMSGMGDLDGAIPFFREAIRLDQDFAMAYAKLGFMQAVASDANPEALINLEKALEKQERLTRREQLYVSAIVASFSTPAEMKEAWSLLVHSFPQFAEGYRMLGAIHNVYENDYSKAVDYLQQAVALPDAMNAVAHLNLSTAFLGLSRYEEALSSAQTAWDESRQPMGGGLASVHISMRNYAAAEEFISANLDHPSRFMRHQLQIMLSMSYLDQGKFRQARTIAEQAESTAPGELGTRQQALAVQCAVLEKQGSPDELFECLRKVIELDRHVFRQGVVPRRYWPSANLMFVAIIFARNGWAAEAAEIHDAVEAHARQSGFFALETYASILQAELLMTDGDTQASLRILEPLTARRSLFQTHESLARAYRLAGDPERAIDRYRWIIENRGQAFAQQTSRGFSNGFHILDWVAAHAKLGRMFEDAGRPEDALTAYNALLEHWAEADEAIPVVEESRRRAEALEQTDVRASQ